VCGTSDRYTRLTQTREGPYAWSRRHKTIPTSHISNKSSIALTFRLLLTSMSCQNMYVACTIPYQQSRGKFQFSFVWWKKTITGQHCRRSPISKRYIYIYMCVCVSIYIYLYLYRYITHRSTPIHSFIKFDLVKEPSLPLNIARGHTYTQTTLDAYIYIYIYIFSHIDFHDASTDARMCLVSPYDQTCGIPVIQTYPWTRTIDMPTTFLDRDINR
jgi:hypothetical protein